MLFKVTYQALCEELSRGFSCEILEIKEKFEFECELLKSAGV